MQGKYSSTGGSGFVGTAVIDDSFPRLPVNALTNHRPSRPTRARPLDSRQPLRRLHPARTPCTAAKPSSTSSALLWRSDREGNHF